MSGACFARCTPFAAGGVFGWSAPCARPGPWGALLLLAVFFCGSLGPLATARAQVATDARQSGYTYMSRSTQSLQSDDSLNPAMLWVADGAARWHARPGADRQSCADCHGRAEQSMRGVAVRYPAFNPTLQRSQTLAQRVDTCRQQRQGLPGASSSEDAAVLALTTYVAHQSRGLPLAAATDGRADAEYQLGRSLWQQPMGQLSLSCAMCHERLAGQRLAGSAIPQGHPTGYPLYRLEWQSVGSLQRRLRSCMSGVRAQPFADGAPEWVALELFLARRAAGMTLETPAVRP